MRIISNVWSFTTLYSLAFSLCILQSTLAFGQHSLSQPSQARPESWQILAPHFVVPEQHQDEYGGLRSPLEVDGAKLTKASQWGNQRARLRQQWHDRMGAWPALIEEPEIELIQSEQKEGFVQQTIRFHWTPIQKTTAYLLVPSDVPPEVPLPAVVTVYYEPETAVGIAGSASEVKPFRDFALQLVKRGFVTLSLGTTEATQDKTYALYHPSIGDAKVQPLSMLAYAATNAWFVLAQHAQVDPDRIGIVGHSFGGKWAMFAACLSDKFACGVWSDPGIVFDEQRPSVNYWEPWYLGYHPKPWRKRGQITPDNPAFGLYPRLREEGRDLHELHVLMAPRPFLVSGGSEDPPERWRALNHSVEVNQLLGYRNRVGMTNRSGHAPTAESNAVVYAFFEYFLTPP